MDDLAQHVGVGDATAVDGATVRWGPGRVEWFEVEGMDRTVELVEGEGSVD